MKTPETQSGGSLEPVGSVTVIDLTGDETDEQLKHIAWEMFCNAHPVEAYQQNPDGFWEYFHCRAPHMPRDQMVALLKEHEEPEPPNEKVQI
jgi:hypothetical protein